MKNNTSTKTNSSRTNIWACPNCDGHNIITTRLQQGGGKQCFQARCKTCEKVTRLASTWGTHIRASWPVSKRYKALQCLQALQGVSEKSHQRLDGSGTVIDGPDYVAICGKKPVEMAQTLYGGPKPLIQRWEWVK